MQNIIKSREIDNLNARWALIRANPKQSVEDLQGKLDRAPEAYDKASDVREHKLGAVD